MLCAVPNPVASAHSIIYKDKNAGFDIYYGPREHPKLYVECPTQFSTLRYLELQFAITPWNQFQLIWTC
jgi:hypothetical protein